VVSFVNYGTKLKYKTNNSKSSSSTQNNQEYLHHIVLNCGTVGRVSVLRSRQPAPDPHRIDPGPPA